MNRRLPDPGQFETRAEKLRSQAKISMALFILGLLALGAALYVLGWEENRARLTALSVLSMTGLAYLDMRSRFRHAKKLLEMGGGLQKHRR